MTSLAYFLDKIDQLSLSIQELKFEPPGIFSNAIIKKPSIIQLLKDANYNEQLLYKIKTNEPLYGSTASEKVKESQMNLEPERVDGKCYYIDPEVSKMEPESSSTAPAVEIPKLAKGIKRKSDTSTEFISSSPTKLSKKIDTITDINEIYRLLINTMNKIPNIDEDEEFVNQIFQLKRQHDQLVQEIDQLEKTSEEQKQQLRNSNVDYRSSEPPEVGSDRDNSTESDVDIDALIRQEENELQELEQQLLTRASG